MTHNIAAAGGDTKFNYKSNLSYYNERGIIENTGFARYTMGLNTEYMPTQRFRLFTSITASLGNQSMGSGTGMMQGGVATAASASSLLPPPSFFLVVILLRWAYLKPIMKIKPAVWLLIWMCGMNW